MFKQFCLLFFSVYLFLNELSLLSMWWFLLSSFISCYKIFSNICSALLNFVLYLLCTVLFHPKIHFFISSKLYQSLCGVCAILFCVTFYFLLNFSEFLIISLWNYFMCVYFLTWSVNSFENNKYICFHIILIYWEHRMVCVITLVLNNHFCITN